MVEKIIFLDIDGIVASRRHDGVRAQSNTRISELDPVAVQSITLACRQHNAKVVIISTWANEGKDNVLDQLMEAGFDPALLHADWRIDDVRQNRRGPSIARWCEAHGTAAENTVILDDKDGKYSKIQRRRWIQPDGASGLSEENVQPLHQCLTETHHAVHARRSSPRHHR